MTEITFDSMFSETWQANRDEDHNPRIILREAEVISVVDANSGCSLVISGRKLLAERIKRAKSDDDVIGVKWLKVSLDFNSYEFPTLLMLVTAVRGGHDLPRKMLATICEAMA